MSDLIEEGKVMIDLRALAKIARSSELHDLKVGLTPDEVDSVADRIEELEAENERLSHNGCIFVNANADLKGRIEELEAENEQYQALLEGCKRIKEKSQSHSFSRCSLGRGEETGWEHAYWEIMEPLEAALKDDD